MLKTISQKFKHLIGNFDRILKRLLFVARSSCWHTKKNICTFTFDLLRAYMSYSVVADTLSVYHTGDSDTHMASDIDNHSILMYRVFYNSIQCFHSYKLQIWRFMINVYLVAFYKDLVCATNEMIKSRYFVTQLNFFNLFTIL